MDASGNARITGFHLAQHTSRVVSMAEFQNMQWTAPEASVETETPSTEADVFSFGIVMIEVCYNSITACPPKLTTLSLCPGARPLLA